MTRAEHGTPQGNAAFLKTLAVVLLAGSAVFLSSCGAYFLLYPRPDPVAEIVALVAGAVGVVLFSAGWTGVLTCQRSRRHPRNTGWSP